MSTTLRPPSARSGRAEAVDTLARTLYGEARGEGLAGMEAVASVILNRVAVAAHHGDYWWGRTVVEVCRAPWQFSCWNEGDPNHALLSRERIDDPVFAMCTRVARRAVAGLIEDPTGGATHYHHRAITPAWTAGRTPCAEIGAHLFYNDIEGDAS